jgi:transcriptional regulator with XRE-family HTH domain
MDLGRTVKLLRTASGLRQREVATKIGVTSNYLSLVENGKREPSVSFLKRLAGILNVPVGVFFLWEKPGISSEKGLDEVRDLVTRLEAMYVFAKRGKVTARQGIL